jgi:hypothetical protein
MNNICPKCEKEQWSLSDKHYLRIYNICWECDKEKWESGKLALEEFEKRESIAANEAVRALEKL